MQTIFERQYFLRTADFDTYGRIKLSSIMDLFQDVAGIHAEQLGCGFDDLIKSNLMWVLVRLKLEIISSPSIFQCVNVKTWPLSPARALFQREYLIEDENGNTLIKGSSDWVIIHSEKRKLMPVKDIYPIKDGFEEKRNFEEKLSKIHDFETENPPYTVNPGFTDIDRNGHVNNTRYAAFVLDAVSPNKNDKIKVFQIDYRHEVVSGTKLSVFTAKNEKEVLAKGLNSENETMFVCRIVFE